RSLLTPLYTFAVARSSLPQTSSDAQPVRINNLRYFSGRPKPPADDIRSYRSSAACAPPAASDLAVEAGLHQLRGAQHRARLVLGLLPLVLGNRVGDDARGSFDVERAVLDDRGADRDREVEVADERDVAAGAAVQAAPGRLELVDDLHRADLRRARQGAGREGRAQHVDRTHAGLELALDVRDDVHHVRVLLDRQPVGDAHAADLG